MEQGNSTTDREREVCEILLNIPNLIKRSEFCDEIIVWGVRGKRSAIDLTPLPPHHRQPEKTPRIAAEGSCPGSPRSLPSSKTDDTVQQYRKNVHKTMWREELTETIDTLVRTRESLTRELEKVTSHHKELKAYNKVLQAKRQELQLPERGPKNIHNPCNQMPSSSSPLSLPNLVWANVNDMRPPDTLDLNIPAGEVVDVEYLQPLHHNRQALGDNSRARAAEARKRRMDKLRKMKLNRHPSADLEIRTRKEKIYV